MLLPQEHQPMRPRQNGPLSQSEDRHTNGSQQAGIEARRAHARATGTVILRRRCCCRGRRWRTRRGRTRTAAARLTRKAVQCGLLALLARLRGRDPRQRGQITQIGSGGRRAEAPARLRSEPVSRRGRRRDDRHAAASESGVEVKSERRVAGGGPDGRGRVRGIELRPLCQNTCRNGGYCERLGRARLDPGLGLNKVVQSVIIVAVLAPIEHPGLAMLRRLDEDDGGARLEAHAMLVLSQPLSHKH